MKTPTGQAPHICDQVLLQIWASCAPVTRNSQGPSLIIRGRGCVRHCRALRHNECGFLPACRKFRQIRYLRLPNRAGPRHKTQCTVESFVLVRCTIEAFRFYSFGLRRLVAPLGWFSDAPLRVALEFVNVGGFS
jgi:hypothetical protein